MTRSHNLKAQEAECTEQGRWRETRVKAVHFLIFRTRALELSVCVCVWAHLDPHGSCENR